MKLELAQFIALAALLANRLERISADSYWAHQASGIRGSLLRLLESYERIGRLTKEEMDLLVRMIERGYQLLTLAAREKCSLR